MLLPGVLCCFVYLIDVFALSGIFNTEVFYTPVHESSRSLEPFFFFFAFRTLSNFYPSSLEEV